MITVKGATLRVAVLMFGILGVVHRSSAVEIYSNNFQSAVGSEWSSSTTDAAPANAARRFLGRFADGIVSLSLSNLPAHSHLSIDFDLLITASWDGDGPEPGTPDIWSLNVNGGPELLRTTFSNFPGRTQDYPGTYDGVPNGATNPPKSGASEVNTLGYGGFIDFPGGDSVYRLRFVFPHAASSVQFGFRGGPGLTSVDDEGWGIDNISVQAVPEPGGVLVLGLGYLALFRRRGA
jgi:hypothetical protein